MQWQIFQFIGGHFDQLLLAAVTGISNAMAGYMQVVIVLAVTLWIAGMLIQDLLNPGTDNPFSNLLRYVIRGTIIITLSAAATYNDMFIRLIWTDIPTDLLRIVANAGGAGVGANQVGYAAFDAMINQEWVGLVAACKNLSVLPGQSWLIALFAGLEFLASLVFITFAFVFYFVAHFLSGIAVSVGELFLAFALWERTIPWFVGWLGVILSAICTQLLLTVMLAIFIAAEADVLRTMIQSNTGTTNADDLPGMLHLMMNGLILVVLLAFLSPQVRDMARSIFGGIGSPVGSVAKAVGIAMRAGSGGGGLGGSTTPAPAPAGPTHSAAGMRWINPPGRVI